MIVDEIGGRGSVLLFCFSSFQGPAVSKGSPDPLDTKYSGSLADKSPPLQPRVSGLKNNAVFGVESGAQYIFVGLKEEKIARLTKINGGG